MAYDSRFMKRPVTRVNYPANPAVAEFPLTGPKSAPTALGDANVYQIPDVMKKITDESNEIPEDEVVWQFQYRITGPTADATNGTIVIWCYNKWSEQWYAGPLIPIVGVDNLSATIGNVIQMPGILGISHIGIEVIDLDAADTIHFLQMAA